MKIITLAVLLFMSQFVFGQSHSFNSTQNFNYDNSVNLEILGHGKYYSVNYERVISSGYTFTSTYSGGISYFNQATANAELRIPIMTTELISFYPHHIELGVGQIGILKFDNTVLSEFNLFTTVKLGYRYQEPDGRLILKVLFTPVFGNWRYFNFFYPSTYSSSSNFLGIVPWGAASIGFAF